MPPKKVRLITAYSLLATLSVAVLGYDAQSRNLFITQRQPETAQVEPPPYVPEPLTRLADSPFLKHSRSIASTKPLPDQGVEEVDEPASAHERHAPTGVYFLTVPVRAEAKGHGQMLRPGTRVRLISKTDRKLKVTRNGADFIVEEWQVTDDVDVAMRLARSQPTS